MESKLGDGAPVLRKEMKEFTVFSLGILGGEDRQYYFRGYNHSFPKAAMRLRYWDYKQRTKERAEMEHTTCPEHPTKAYTFSTWRLRSILF